MEKNLSSASFIDVGSLENWLRDAMKSGRCAALSSVCIEVTASRDSEYFHTSNTGIIIRVGIIIPSITAILTRVAYSISPATAPTGI